MKALEAIATAIQSDDRDLGHLGADQQWGKYESNAMAALVELKRRLAGTACEAAIDAMIAGTV